MRRILLLSAVLSLVLPGATPVGVITGAGAIDINGQLVSREMSGAVTIFNGDEIKTGRSTAVVWLSGRARLTVDRESTVQVERKLGSTEFTLRQGALRFQTDSRGRLSIRAGDHSVTPDGDSEGAVILRTGRTAEAITVRGSASVVDKSTGTYRRLAGQTGLLLTGPEGRMLFTGQTASSGLIRFTDHEEGRKACPASPTKPKDLKCKCPPPSDHTNPPEGDRNCGHGNGP